MMATAEPGMVFKYPFLTRPLTLEDIELLVISNATLIKLNECARAIPADSLFVLDPEQYADRGIVERCIADEMNRRNLVPAMTVPTAVKPARLTSLE